MFTVLLVPLLKNVISSVFCYFPMNLHVLMFNSRFSTETWLQLSSELDV